MSRAVAIGDGRRLAGYALAGVEVHDVVEAARVEAAWESLGEDVALLVLTPEAYAVLETSLEQSEQLVWAVLPS
jgi:vacuolar-type H+-ATPase subunit F/Vma7